MISAIFAKFTFFLAPADPFPFTKDKTDKEHLHIITLYNDDGGFIGTKEIKSVTKMQKTKYQKQKKYQGMHERTNSDSCYQKKQKKCFDPNLIKFVRTEIGFEVNIRLNNIKMHVHAYISN